MPEEVEHILAGSLEDIASPAECFHPPALPELRFECRRLRRAFEKDGEGIEDGNDHLGADLLHLLRAFEIASSAHRGLGLDGAGDVVLRVRRHEGRCRFGGVPVLEVVPLAHLLTRAIHLSHQVHDVLGSVLVRVLEDVPLGELAVAHHVGHDRCLGDGAIVAVEIGVGGIAGLHHLVEERRLEPRLDGVLLVHHPLAFPDVDRARGIDILFQEGGELQPIEDEEPDLGNPASEGLGVVKHPLFERGEHRIRVDATHASLRRGS